ncbi:MAG: LPP20 family lipoprotein [Elusimicrobiota bacterium]
MRKLGYGCLVLLIGCLAGCGGAPVVKGPQRPDWVMKGAGAFPNDKKSLYGVGIAENITSVALRRTTADNRAISEISKQLSVVSTALMRDYQSSASATEEEKASGEQYVENTVKTFTSNMMSGVQVRDRYDEGNTAYSLAVLNVDDLKSLTENVRQLSQQAKEYIKANAEKAFDKLDQEQEKTQP